MKEHAASILVPKQCGKEVLSYVLSLQKVGENVRVVPLPPEVNSSSPSVAMLLTFPKSRGLPAH
jgi:hypothetical protein